MEKWCGQLDKREPPFNFNKHPRRCQRLPRALLSCILYGNFGAVTAHPQKIAFVDIRMVPHKTRLFHRCLLRLVIGFIIVGSLLGSRTPPIHQEATNPTLMLLHRLFQSNTTNQTVIPSSPTNDSSICHPLLLEIGAKSEKGLCDDQISARVMSGLVLVAHIILVVVSLVGLFWKMWRLRKSNSEITVNYLTTARNPALMVFGALIGLSYNVIMLGRVLISRKIYPCFLFMFCYYLAVPGLASTVLLRCIRLIILSRMNDLKVKIGSKGMKEISQELETVDSVSSRDNTSEVSMTPRDFSEASSGAPVVTSMNGSFKLSLTSFEQFERDKLLKFYKFLISSYFVAIFYGVILSIHIAIYIVIGAIDYADWNFGIGIVDRSSTSSSFVANSYIFSTTGCGNGSKNVSMFVSYLAIYGISAIVCVIISQFMKRDIWKIKLEITLVAVNWLFFAVIYGVGSIVPAVDTLVDYYFPIVIFILLACMLDLFISCTMPVFFFQKITESQTTNDIQKCLHDPKWNNMFLNYCQRAYCVENILCWNMIQKFQSAPEKIKKELLRIIADTYLREGSPLELNVARKTFNNFENVFELVELIEAESAEQNEGTATPRRRRPTVQIPKDFLDKIQKACEHNMMDCFDRFYADNCENLKKELGLS